MGYKKKKKKTEKELKPGIFLSTFIILYSCNIVYATRTHAPPTSLIFSSALRLKNLAFTITGCLGRRPLPSTL